MTPENPAIVTDTVKIDGSNSFLIGADGMSDINDISFVWICDEPFDKICEAYSISRDI